MLSGFSRLPEPRKPQGKAYELNEILMAGLSLFLFKEGSRNEMNNHRSAGNFSKHYRQLFNMKLPQLDCVNDVLKALPNEALEQLKMDLMSELFEQKWLRDYRLLDKYYLVAVDATGIMSFDERHCEYPPRNKFR